ncbi:MAG: FGGY-family carbohydrate kinase [Thermotogaceae bacterium]|nr:FGGY-family carbohydrate kinase [Thermotogaceae bacterium]
MLSLIVDVGTQRMKVSVFNTRGEIVRKESVEYNPPYFSPKPGWAEYNPEDYWETFLKLAKKVVNGLEKRIKAVAVTTQRDSLIFMDKEGKVLRPMILWLDHREAEYDLRLPFYEKFLYWTAGKLSTIRNVYKGAVVNWIRQNEPHIWKKAYKIVQLSGFFMHRLTGEFVDSVASQIGHIPFDYKRQTWCDKSDIKAKLFPIPKEKLVNLVKPCTIVGKLKKSVREDLGIDAYVVAAGSDKGCETIGVGVVKDDEISLSLSTTSTVQTTTRKYFETIPHLPPYPGIIEGTYNPEVEIFRGFWLVRWFRDEFAHLEKRKAQKIGIPPEEIINEMLKSVPAGSMGLITYPFWTPSLDKPEARGSIIGFQSFHKREHLYKSLIEGLFYALREGKEMMERRGKLKFKVAKIAGGGSKSDEVASIAASILGLPVYRELTKESASLGAAIVSFCGMEAFDDVEKGVKEMVHLEGPFEPDDNEREIYDFIYEEVYKKLFKRLKKLYDKLYESKELLY